MEPEQIKTETAAEPTRKEKAYSIVNITVFVMLILAGGVMSLTLPKESVSESEKRMLTPVPHFSWNSLFHGGYTDSLDLYFADNFPYRERFLSLSGSVKKNFGILDHEIGIYNVASIQPGQAEEEDTAFNFDAEMAIADSVANAADSTVGPKQNHPPKPVAQPPMPDKLTNDAEIVKSILIYNGRAMQMFGGSKVVGGAYAKMINSYKKALGNDVNVFCLIPPGPVDFYLGDKFRKMSNSELKNIAYIYSKLDSNVTPVDAGTEISAHKDEYLYFNTDHHWTGRGAYYAYRAFCQSAGFTPYELSQFKRRIIKGFYGSLYFRTRDPRLPKGGDSVEYFRLPVATKAFIYKDKSLTNPVKSTVLVEYAKGVNSYSVFLGGDFPLMRIVSNNKNGRKILIMKDSYGNAMAPFFALHYEEVYIVDYRYFTANLIDLIKTNKITDLIFLHNGFVSNSKYTIRKETYLMKSAQHAPAISGG